MLLVLWVIRLLNGADITPGGQGVGFDCVIEFSFFLYPPSSSSSSSSFLGAERKIFVLRLAARVEEHVFGSGWITGFFRTWVTMATPMRKCVCVTTECVFACVCGVWICAHAFLRECVCAPVSLSALLCCHLQPDKPKDLSPTELPLSGG